ncbi:hypothetical protein BJY00DRAFT_320396 [Aspergillus carlsbadensis]|nr:hypothetical protein BJY00DRAFT_320396 [Aspergillus carlsbadensis]
MPLQNTFISMATASNPTIACAENIAILYLLRSVPAPPSRNCADCLPIFQKHSTLSFDMECKLVSTLAFIAHNKDDVEHIPAICLDEDAESGCLKIIFAVNKASHNDGDKAICRIQQGLDHIFAILATVSETGDPILTAVVSMCSSRILSRLRLVCPSRKAMKRPLKGTLREALLAVKIARQKRNSGILFEAAGSFTLRAKELEKLLDSWSQYQVDRRLVKVVEGIYQLQQIKGLPDLIYTIPNKDMDPSSRKSLLNIISKVSRYWEAARFLYRLAKKSPLARAMITVPVRLPKEVFSIPASGGYTPDLRSKTTEATGSQQKLLQEICAILKLSQEDALKKYSCQVIRTLSTAKIHAEMQLIAHCELESPGILPRVICSSKDACFLCNLCLQLYQKTYTPRSHGRLYPRWRLPSMPQLAELEQRFSQVLGHHFTETCAALLSTRQSAIYPVPNESTLLTLPLSRTTTRVSILSETTSQVDPLPRSNKVSIDGVNGKKRTKNTALAEKRDTPSDSRTSSHYYTKPKEVELEYCTLPQWSKEYGSLSPGESSRVYRAGSSCSLEIQIEHATGLNDLTYYLEWVGGKEAMEARTKCSSPQLIDTEHLEGIITLSEQKPVYLMAKGTVLKVSWASGPTSLPLAGHVGD